MTCWLVKLNFYSPLHLGQDGIGMEKVDSYLRSDTLFGALCHALAAIYGRDAVDALLYGFNTGRPPFLLTSAFPYFKETFFLPKPLGPAPVSRERMEDVSYLKELNKLEFLSLEAFARWAKGKSVSPTEVKKIKETYACSRVYHLVPRVQLDRVTAASGIYHAGMIVFSPGAGLYCLIKSENQEVVHGLEAAFRWLGETGLGGMRSLGLGLFEPEWQRAEGKWQLLLEDNKKAKTRCLLSLYHPSEKEINLSLNGSYYEIIERRGWSSSPFAPGQVKRKSCRMFAEGSVLDYSPGGCLVNITPEKWDAGRHRLYRYGYAFAVPVGVN